MGLFSDDNPKYKIDLVEHSETNEHRVGLYRLEDGYYILRFTFMTEQQARDFIPQLEQYPKFVEV